MDETETQDPVRAERNNLRGIDLTDDLPENHRFPSYLTGKPIWHLWEDVSGRKIPKQLNGQNARPNDPSTFVSYEQLRDLDQKALTICVNHDITGIDLDNCFRFDEDGEPLLRDWAKPIVERLLPVAFGEYSPSGTGIKFLLRGKKPDGARCTVTMGDGPKEQLEVYDKTRFWTMTGLQYEGSQSELEQDGQDVIDWICETCLTPTKRASITPTETSRLLTSNGVALRDRAIAYANKSQLPPVGGRNAACFKMAGHLFSMGGDMDERLTVNEVHHIVENWALSQGAEPREGEIRKAVESALKNGTAREEKPAGVPSSDTSGVDLSAIEARQQGKGDGVDTGRRLPACDLDEHFKRCATKSSRIEAPDLVAPGIIEDVISYNLSTAIYPQPELAFAGALALMSAITGRKIQDYRKTRTNMMIIGTGPTTCGKDHARKINKQLLELAGHGHIAGTEKFTSAPGVVTALYDSPVSLFQIDEFGKFLRAMTSGRASSHLAEVIPLLMMAEGSASGVWRPNAHADSKLNKHIDQPHCVVYGTTVPDALWDAMTRENVKDGFLNRFLVIESRGYVMPEDPVFCAPPEEIVGDVRWWLDEFLPGGNMRDVSPQPVMVEWDDDARERICQHERNIAERRLNESEERAALWGRTAANSRRMSLIFAASRARRCRDIAVELQDVDRAIAISNWNTRATIAKAFENIADNEQEKSAKKVLKTLAKPLSQRDLTRKTQWLKRREREEMLSDLIESEQIVAWNKPSSSGPPKQMFLATSKLADHAEEIARDRAALSPAS